MKKHPTVNTIRNLEGVPAESEDLYAAAEWFKAEGYRIVKLDEESRDDYMFPDLPDVWSIVEEL